MLAHDDGAGATREFARLDDLEEPSADLAQPVAFYGRSFDGDEFPAQTLPAFASAATEGEVMLGGHLFVRNVPDSNLDLHSA